MILDACSSQCTKCPNCRSHYILKEATYQICFTVPISLLFVTNQLHPGKITMISLMGMLTNILDVISPLGDSTEHFPTLEGVSEPCDKIRLH